MPVLQRRNWGSERWNYFVPCYTSEKVSEKDKTWTHVFLSPSRNFPTTNEFIRLVKAGIVELPGGVNGVRKNYRENNKGEEGSWRQKWEVGRDSWRWVWCYGWSVLFLLIASVVPVLPGWLSPAPISVELLQGEHFPSCEEPSPGDTYERNNISGLLPFRFLKLLEGMWGSRDDGKHGPYAS